MPDVCLSNSSAKLINYESSPKYHQAAGEHTISGVQSRMLQTSKHV